MLDVTLRNESQGVSTYNVAASGWNQPMTEQIVAILKIDGTNQEVALSTVNDWAAEAFYLPEYGQLLAPTAFPMEKLNQRYGWWHVLLIRAINGILSKPEYRQRVLFYQ